MTQEHPITPPPELTQEWSCDCPLTDPFSREFYVATQAARWGADKELEACCEWVNDDLAYDVADRLRAARRPKSPTLKEQALEALENLNGECLLEGFECPEKVATIRRALDALPE